MDKRIASPLLRNDLPARQLMELLDGLMRELSIRDAIFYYDFPIFRDESNQLYRSKALLLTRTRGVFVFATLGDVRPNDIAEIKKLDRDLAQLDSIIYGKLLRSKLLRRGKRDVATSVNSALFTLDKIAAKDEFENTLIVSEPELREHLQQGESDQLNDSQWEELIALIEGGKGIAKVEERDTADLRKDSRAAILAEIERRIANFDNDQRRAALTVVNGPQRIRGIAGSGKTIVLAMKAAHLHLANPEAMILIAFWTKSLYDLLRQQITRFYRQFNDRDPDWEKLHVLHAWGGRNTEGVYYNACVENGRRPLTLKEIMSFGNRSRFDYACKDILRFRPLTQKYDYSLIDEGQDLPASFYQLCFEVCKGGLIDRNVIWAYDELQTIMDVEPQNVTSTFGTTMVDDKQVARVDLERAQKELSGGLLAHDIVLKKSYRNPPEILVCAHALGMGIYGREVVQMLENAAHWNDLGYAVEKGTFKVGEETIITRPAENSPLNLSDYVDRKEIIKTQAPKEMAQELDWVCKDILAFLGEGLRPHDILVISLDDKNARTYFSGIGKRLAEHEVGINNLQDAAYTIPKFFLEGHISVSTVYKAKGNEAPVVYVVGVDAITPYLDDVRARNRLFTAFTRSRAWLRVSGMAPYANRVISEIERALELFPRMVFAYPDPKRIRTIQRDLTEKTAKLRELQQKMLELEITDVSEDDILQALRVGKTKKE